MLTVDASVWVGAFDPADRFHDGSYRFLRATASLGTRLYAPDFAVLEVGCAIARWIGDAAAGLHAAKRLSEHPALTLQAMDYRLTSTALEVGVAGRLRAADALYAGTALLTGSTLIAWGAELVSRATGLTPSQWLESA